MNKNTFLILIFFNFNLILIIFILPQYLENVMTLNCQPFEFFMLPVLDVQAHYLYQGFYQNNGRQIKNILKFILISDFS